MGHLRLLRIALEVLLGAATPPHHHTPSGLPVAYALAGAKTDERDTALDTIALDPELHRRGQTLMADKGYRRAGFETELADAGITLIRPTYGKEPPRPHQRFLRPFRQIIESVNQTLKPDFDG